RREQFCAQAGEPRLVLGGSGRGLQAIEDRVALEISGRRHVIVAGGKKTGPPPPPLHHLPAGTNRELPPPPLPNPRARRPEQAPSAVVISRASQPTVSCARVRNSARPERTCASASSSRSCALS